MTNKWALTSDWLCHYSQSILARNSIVYRVAHHCLLEHLNVCEPKCRWKHSYSDWRIQAKQVNNGAIYMESTSLQAVQVASRRDFTLLDWIWRPSKNQVTFLQHVCKASAARVQVNKTFFSLVWLAHILTRNLDFDYDSWGHFIQPISGKLNGSGLIEFITFPYLLCSFLSESTYILY